ncbi:hypothetical protein [Enterovirga sp.]|jgi:hypothetical protein|uniref:hypothetical protein n=1 Tax=Enterovirga sp. TaxID=2026350 RepID=UPI00260197D2|nr:hypothetical protein [Enterovirga sp.]MDB5592769.1 hypothetical protein [Enterovirga sp.]
MRPSAEAALRTALLGAALLASGLAAAQPMPPPAFRGAPAGATPEPSLPALPTLPAVPPAATPAVNGTGSETLSLSASFAGDTRPIRSGLVWRIYESPAPGSEPKLLHKLTTPTPTATLPLGTYLVHVAYGLASTTKRITLTEGAVTERLSIAAGGLRIAGAIGDVPIPPNRLSVAIFQPLPNDNEGRLIAANIKSGDLVRLPEGSYHVVSTYGESNAIMRADLKVDRGRITDATLNHRAATLTLKLVAHEAGEAFAGTAFSVLTPGGDVIREAIGAFPTVTLAEGDYVLIARHGGKVYTREFKVESGLDRDVEVLVTPG